LPYLSQPTTHFRRQSPLNHQIIRLLSTETRKHIKDQLYLFVKWTVVGWTFVGLFGMIWLGYNIEADERTNPTPEEWRFLTRHILRAGRVLSDPEETAAIGKIVDWANVGSKMLNCLQRLEDPAHEGKDLQEAGGDGEEILIPGVGRAGFDVSAKSWPWKAGYFEVVMFCARAAEHLDGMVLDKTRGIVFPQDVMIGPSNPDPRPMPSYMKEPPLEENCVDPYPGPETFYMRILTGRGFTTGQRLQAALSYANWLEYKELDDAAMEMYKWGIDIAAEGLAPEVSPSDVVDRQKFLLMESASDKITPNMLRAVTSLAIHQARTGNIDSALPILLTVLRARRAAPVSPLPNTTPEQSGFSLWNILFVPPKFPDPSPSGDLPLMRTSEEPTCTESEIMLYIGEILFAGSKANAEEGLGWTKQAVTIADRQLSNNPRLTNGTDMESQEEMRKCKECLLTGVGNWKLMLERLAQQPEPVTSSGGLFSWWSPSSGPAGNKMVNLEQEKAQVDALQTRIVQEGLARQVNTSTSQTGTWFT
jgi:hypothetical protein